LSVVLPFLCSLWIILACILVIRILLLPLSLSDMFFLSLPLHPAYFLFSFSFLSASFVVFYVLVLRKNICRTGIFEHLFYLFSFLCY
jgi:hypothetical protein